MINNQLKKNKGSMARRKNTFEKKKRSQSYFARSTGFLFILVFCLTRTSQPPG